GPGDPHHARAGPARRAGGVREGEDRQGVGPRGRAGGLRRPQVQGHPAVRHAVGERGGADRAAEGGRVRPVEDARAAGAVVRRRRRAGGRPRAGRARRGQPERLQAAQPDPPRPPGRRGAAGGRGSRGGAVSLHEGGAV
ncbi:MAG: hypothetical protein AVDCRST_MAG64-4057, partial [uncultured Phycisphaerae bacterium]